MIFFDTETTGLITNVALPLPLQPQIIELGVVKCANDGTILEQFSAFVNPGRALAPEIVAITGITDTELAAAPRFVTHWPRLVELFLGERELVAHNAPFDASMLVFELRRIGKEFLFPYPPRLIDTKAIWPGKLSEWALKVKGPDYVQPHRALEDALLLRECFLTTRAEAA